MARAQHACVTNMETTIGKDAAQPPGPQLVAIVSPVGGLYLCDIADAMIGPALPWQVLEAGIDFALVRTGAVDDDDALDGAQLQAGTVGQRLPTAKVQTADMRAVPESCHPFKNEVEPRPDVPP